jgi:hypothetical protein
MENLPVERLVPEARSREEPNGRPDFRQLGHSRGADCHAALILFF